MSAAFALKRPAVDAREAERAALREEAAILAAALPPFGAGARLTPPGLIGPHGRRRAGSGDEFWQYRRSQPGDGLADIDWRRSARSDHLFVREREWQSSQTVWIWRDASASMSWRSDDGVPEKRRRADVIALALAILLAQGGEIIGALGGGEAATGGAAGLQRLTRALLDDDAFGREPPRADAISAGQHVVLISDFLDDLAALESFAEACAARAVHGCALRILDPAEIEFPFEGRTRFEGVEDESRLLAGKAEALRKPYVEALAQNQDRLDALWRGAGWPCLVHRTDKPGRKALLPLCRALEENPGAERRL